MLHNSDRIQSMELDSRIERLLLNGHRNQRQLAAAIGISQQAIAKRITKIHDRWQNERIGDIDKTRDYRIRQLEALIQKSLNAYELSSKVERKVEEEFDCNECKGFKQLEDMPGEFVDCPVCKGVGKTKDMVIQVVTIPGDPSYLKLCKDLIVEVSKLEGIHPQKAMTSMEQRSIIRTSNGTTQEIREEVRKLYYESEDDALVNARAMIDLIKRKKVTVDTEFADGDDKETAILRADQNQEKDPDDSDGK